MSWSWTNDKRYAIYNNKDILLRVLYDIVLHFAPTNQHN